MKEIFDFYQNHSLVDHLKLKLQEKIPQEIEVKGLAGSASSFVSAALFRHCEKPLLIVLPEKEEAAYFLNDVESLLGEKDVFFYPASYRRPYEIEKTDNANVLLRAEVLNRINSRKKAAVIISYADALFEQVVTRKELNQNTLNLSEGEKISLDFLNETLFEYQFERVDYVTQAGEFSVRGGIVDVYSFANNLPFRIEFYGDEVDSIRTFDVESQLSIDRVPKMQILPNLEDKQLLESRESLLEYLPTNCWIWMREPDRVYKQLDSLFEKSKEAYSKLSGSIAREKPENLFIDGKTLEASLFHRHRILETTNASLSFECLPQPAFNKHFKLLSEKLNELTAQGYKNYLICSNSKQVDRFEAIFKDIGQEVDYHPITGVIHGGFIDKNLKISCFTDHQIFERYQRFKLKTGFEKQKAITLMELNSLQYGDYVAHIDHGVGQFGGLQKIEVNGKIQEAIKLTYRDSDVLYISIHSLHKISKYNGKEGTAPVLHKLGSGAWSKLKAKTKTRVRELAFDLIQLYAKRKSNLGFQYSPDTYLQHELEASFLFEDTPDQIKATADVKADMESPTPMDRLICGDVGFGKTEIAVRAAFKAVADNKQVAVLVPTTILAFQHHKTFSERLADMPCKVEYINRFRTAKEQKEILEGLANGKVDILIGTHKLIGKDVKFKDLGLLIIDEEQKFGVSVKEKLKTLKVNVDTLTLTATPIPRTLQFSLMAARDLSVMTTPPPNRQPIETRILSFDEESIRDAISFEIQRNGQVFFIHNRVENIKEISGMIQRLVPDARVGIGHGQMDGKKLEELMLSFMDGSFDVLVSTTIIENGLDVPNANTIIIHQAQNFGLGDLHQMRGRVGRSNRKAFCYLIAPPLHHMTEEARKRLQAIELFSDLGSGFNIAMRDLEIRGAGDILGAEQSGFISDMGFDMYQKVLAEAVQELKETDFKDLYAHEKNEHFIADTQLDTDLEILIPDSYVNQVEERLKLYQALDSLEEEAQLYRFEQELIDRFGPAPETVYELLNSIRLRWIANEIGFEKLVLKQSKLIGYFVGEQQHPFFQSEVFKFILEQLRFSKNIQMKERNGRLTLVIEGINDIRSAIESLKALRPQYEKQTHEQ